jgi:sugar-specific transcriptional regulator TrmB
MFQEQVYDVLTELGLHPLQAKVYATLIQLNDPTATAASKFSKIARQEIYRITEELETMGLVARTLSTPVRFQPVLLNEALSILMEQRIKTTSGLMRKIKDINRQAENKVEKAIPSYVIKELSPDEKWFGNSPLKLDTTKEFDLMTSFDRLATRFESDAKVFKRAAASKRTMIRIITDKPQKESSLWEIIRSLCSYPYFQMRFLDKKPDSVIIIFNKKEAALSLSLQKAPGPPYLFANHPAFVYLALEHFESVWNKAEKVPVKAPAD